MYSCLENDDLETNIDPSAPIGMNFAVAGVADNISQQAFRNVVL